MSTPDLDLLRRITRLERDQETTRAQGAPLAIGPAFPASPPTGFLFYRTDLGWLCEYDGTRWLTVHEYSIGNAGGNAANTFADFSASDSFAMIWRLRTDYAPYFTRAAATTRVSTTNTGASYWTIALDCYNLAFGAGTTAYSVATSADAADTYTAHEGTPSTPAPANRHHLALSVQKSGTPGTLRVLFQAFYRLIIT